jgi:hypothetical protein
VTVSDFTRERRKKKKESEKEKKQPVQGLS